MPSQISPLAVIDPRAQLADDVVVGPFCVIGPDVIIGQGTQLAHNVTVIGHTEIGRFNRIHAGAIIGDEPQDISYDGSPTRVIIGDHNVLRECVTINRASTKEIGVTRIHNHCFIMGYVHIAHDCDIGDRVLIANQTILGGHVHIHHNATISGAVAVHHFASIGSYSFVAALSKVVTDVPPYMLCEGVPARPRCVNIVGLKRANFSASAIRSLQEAHRLMFRSRIGIDNAVEILEKQGWGGPEVSEVIEAVRLQSGGRHGRSRDRRKAA
jgi:UDP-N-acetylglucosamine acyltransferase